MTIAKKSIYIGDCVKQILVLFAVPSIIMWTILELIRSSLTLSNVNLEVDYQLVRVILWQRLTSDIFEIDA